MDPTEVTYMVGQLIVSFVVLKRIPFARSLTMAAVQKVALITAGTAGLGAQIARALAPDFRLVSEVHMCKETPVTNRFRRSTTPTMRHVLRNCSRNYMESRRSHRRLSPMRHHDLQLSVQMWAINLLCNSLSKIRCLSLDGWMWSSPMRAGRA